MVYKRSKHINGKDYVVEISLNKKHMFLAAFDVTSPDNYLITQPISKMLKVLRDFDNNYDRLADSLKVQCRRLILVGVNESNRKRNKSMTVNQTNQDDLNSS